MPTYDIHYFTRSGTLALKFSTICIDDTRAKIIAHAMKLPECKKFEVWTDGSLVYQRPSEPVSELYQISREFIRQRSDDVQETE
jgi:hypothetical protein